MTPLDPKDPVVASVKTRSRMASSLPSPKVLADTVTTIIAFVLLYFGIELDAEVSAALAKVLGFLVAYIVRPGRTVEEPA